MKFRKETRDKGFWITPLIAYDTNKPKIRLWFGFLIWLFVFDFNESTAPVGEKEKAE